MKKIMVSVAATNLPTETSFTPRMMWFGELDSITNGKQAFSPGIFENDKRKRENVKFLTTCVLDIDNDNSDLTIIEARKVFEKYIHLITTTKSHQKEKNTRVRDRFRIIFPLKTDVCPDVYSNAVAQMAKAKDFCLNGAIDLGASRDPARLFFANPKAESRYNLKGGFLDLSKWYKEPPAKKSSFSQFCASRVFNGVKNDDLTIKLPNGNVIYKQEIVSMAQDGRTHPCFCPYHDDETASAFFHMKDGKVGVYCVACETGKFYIV